MLWLLLLSRDRLGLIERDSGTNIMAAFSVVCCEGAGQGSVRFSYHFSCVKRSLQLCFLHSFTAIMLVGGLCSLLQMNR